MRLEFAVFLLAAGAALAQPRYDLVLKGGRVIDPKNGVSGTRDVAIANGRIAAVAERIDARDARRVADVTGLYVTPGLVDIHTHVFAGSMGREYTGANDVRPDGFTFRSGVTTVVDAGSSGWRNFSQFREQSKGWQTRVLAMLNIVGAGMAGREDVEQNTADMDARRTAETALANRDAVVGIKVAHYAGPEWLAVDRGVEAGKLAGVPVMVDFATFRPERPFQDLVLRHLRPGDIYTHAYLRDVPMLDQKGTVLPYLFEARKRGVIFDVGHGAGSFYFKQAVPAVAQGFLPDSISTDLHIDSMNAGMKDILNVMSKFLNMGVPLDRVVEMATSAPAREIHREELGTLTPGSEADIAVLRLESGDFGFVDSGRLRMKGSQKLTAEITLRAGKVVWDLNGRTSSDWDAGVVSPVWPPGVKPVGPYSPGLLTKEFLYVSGQGARDLAGNTPADAEGQWRSTFENTKRIVEAAGLTMEHVVYAQAYVAGPVDEAPLNRVFKEYFPKSPPARSLIGVARLPATPVELTVVAVRDLAGKKVFGAGLYSDAVQSGGRLYLSGFCGPDTETALQAMEKALKAAGLSFANLVFVNPYLTAALPMNVMNEVYAGKFEFGNTPARATIQVAALPGGANIEFTGVAVMDLQKRRAIRPKNMDPSPTASPCVFAGDTLFCSAKSGFIPGARGGIYAGTVETQLRQTMRNLLDGLEEAGMDFSNVVSSNVYLDDLEEFARMNGAYAEYFGASPPTRTTVQQLPPGDRNPNARGIYPTLEQISIIAVK